MMSHTGESLASEERSVGEAFIAAFGPARVRRGVSLAPMTTFKTGGAADWFLETAAPGDIVRAVRACREVGLPLTVLGSGSNVLVGGRGVRGLVVRMWHGRVATLGPGVVRADAGLSLNGLVRWTVNHGLAGLERWAGMPGTVGGALCGNAHFRGTLIGDQVLAVDVVDGEGSVRQLDSEAMGFGYDTSRLQTTDEVALSATFSVTLGAEGALRAIARESLSYRKQTQPLTARSAGCIFQNPDPAVDDIPVGIPPSAGELIDRAGLKGRRAGHAQVSLVHGNFIVSDGRASPGEIRDLIEGCRETVRDHFGITLRDEIIYRGEF